MTSLGKRKRTRSRSRGKRDAEEKRSMTSFLLIFFSVCDFQLSNENLLRQSAAVFEKVLNMRKNEPQSYRDLANVHGELGNFERALKLFNEVR